MRRLPPIAMMMAIILSSLAWGLTLGVEQSSEMISSSGSVTRSGQSMVVVALDGSGDYTDIQTAMNHLPSGPTVLYIKQGTYTLGSGSGGSQIKARSDLTIRGDGIGKTIIRRASTQGGNSNLDMLGTTSGVSVRNFVLEDLTLDGMYPDQPNSGGSCIIFSHNQNTVHKNIIIRRVEAKNSRAQFNARNIIGTSWNDFGLIIEDCEFSHGWSGAVWMNCYYVKITGCYIYYTGGDAILPDTTSSNIQGTGGDGACHHFIIENNYCYVSCDTGIDIAAHTARGDARHTDISARYNILVTAQARITGSDDVVFSDNIIYCKDPIPNDAHNNNGVYKSGLSVDAGESPSNNLEVSRNIIQPGTGRRTMRFEQTHNLVCRDNVIYGINVENIQFSSVTGSQDTGGNQYINENMPSSYYARR